MRFMEKLAVCVAGGLAVFFIGLTVLYLSGTPIQKAPRTMAPVATLGATATPVPTATPDCRRAIARYYRTTLAPLIAEWDDAFKLANNSPRISLAPQIATLQAIRRKLMDTEQPPCALDTHLQFVIATDEIIEGFLAFLGKESDYTVSKHFENAAVLLEKVRVAVDNAAEFE